MNQQTPVCVCGDALDTHEDGGYCSAPVEGGFCGCDRFTEAPTAEPAPEPAPASPTTDK